MQLYEAQVDNEIRQTQEYAVINNILRSQYKVDPKSLNGKAQSLAKGLLNNQDYLNIKAKNNFNKKVYDTIGSYVKQKMDPQKAPQKGQDNQEQVQARNEETAGNPAPEAASSSNPNQIFLDYLDNSTNAYKQISADTKEIQSIYISKNGQISYSYKEVADNQQQPTTPQSNLTERKENYIKNLIEKELGINIPDFLSRYLEAEGPSTAGTTAGTAGEVQPNNKSNDSAPTRQNLNDLFSLNVRDALNRNKYSVTRIDKIGADDFKITIKVGNKVKTLDKAGLDSLVTGSEDTSKYDFKMTDQDVLNIQKEILRCLDMGKLGEVISKNVNIGIPYNLSLSLGNILRESQIVNSRLRLFEVGPSFGKKPAVSVHQNAKPIKFLVNFKAQKIESEVSDEPQNREEGQEEKTQSIAGFDEMNEETSIKFVATIKEYLLKGIKKQHSSGLNFPIKKSITLDKSTAGKILTGKEQKTQEYQVDIIVSGGDNSDIKFKKTPNEMEGTFTLTCTAGNKASKVANIVKNIAGVASTLNKIGTSDDYSYNKL